jgi:acetyl esterase/lipase
MGFSAGGHLTMLTGTRYDRGDASSADPIERFSSRPDFLVPVYPLTPQDVHVTKDTPPSFLVHAHDDGLSSENSVRFYLGLKKAGVPAELHIYSVGGHGFGILNRRIPASSWPQRLLDWLAVMEIVRR